MTDSKTTEVPGTGSTRSLQGRRALVTGGGAGLGNIFADALAAAGADLVICGRRAEILEQAAVKLRSHGGTVEAVQSDVSGAEGVSKLQRAAGDIDILINNAGYSMRKQSSLEITPAEWAEVLAINLQAPFMLAPVNALSPGIFHRLVTCSPFPRPGGLCPCRPHWLARSPHPRRYPAARGHTRRRELRPF